MSDMNEDSKQLDAPAGAESGANALRNSLVTRRRFAKAGAASSVVLGSLVAKPVLAYTDKQIYHCTVSGQLSGNFSSHPDVIDCKALGKSPGYWKNNGPWPAGTVQGALNAGMCSSTANSTPVGTYFNGFSSGGSTLINAFKRKTVNSTCLIYNLKESAFGTCTAKATMLQILNTGGGSNDSTIASFGRATIASLLNALRGNYPITPKQVIDMFNAVVNTGSYKLNTTKSWSMAEVQTYFESLYS
jgi:hypothetical protein